MDTKTREKKNETKQKWSLIELSKFLWRTEQYNSEVTESSHKCTDKGNDKKKKKKGLTNIIPNQRKCDFVLEDLHLLKAFSMSSPTLCEEATGQKHKILNISLMINSN